MKEIMFTILVFLLGLIIYKVWIKPIKQINYYTRFLRDHGYKVLRIPYNPFRVHIQNIISKGIEKGDPMIAYKEDFQGYDVIVSNTFTSPLI